MTMLLRLVKLLVAGVGPLLMAHAGAAAGGDWSKDFTINGTADLRVEVDDGRVTLTGTDAKRIEVRVTAAGWQIGPDGVQVLDRQAGDRVEIDVRVPHSMGLFNMGNRSRSGCQMVHWRTSTRTTARSRWKGCAARSS
jgi:hypothetical protein